uniref:Uncharacterized protein n=1 Tax=Arundo donax TaxID=35708 RepID=A0A0A8ZBZ6_ARUDO
MHRDEVLPDCHCKCTMTYKGISNKHKE